MLFDSWYGVVRVVLVGVFGYAGLVAILRVSGKRTLSKMNAFDFVVTVALGSTFATVILSKQVALAEGITAFAVLAGLQFGASWLAARSPSFRHWVKSQPTLLYYKGEFDQEALLRERLTVGEVQAAARERGFSSFSDVGAVVLETAGELSILRASAAPSWDTLDGVRQPFDKTPPG